MNRPLRVLLVAPHPLEQPRGNSVTLERIARGLRQHGVRVGLLGPGQLPPRGRFDLVHAFHAYRAGPRALALAERMNVPCVVSLTGTDVNRDLKAPGRRHIVRRVLAKAAAVIVFIPETQKWLRRRVPHLSRKTRVIPQAAAPRFFLCRAGDAV